MKVIICPGVHDVALSDSFLASILAPNQNQVLLFPTNQYPAYSPHHLYRWICQENKAQEPLFLIAFSAGVVAAMGAILALKLRKIKILGLVAIDGWGVPLWGEFPIYRFSHDYFTHWSSALLGTGKNSFYSDPAVDHLTMWGEPEFCQGWVTQKNLPPRKSTTKDYLLEILELAATNF